MSCALRFIFNQITPELLTGCALPPSANRNSANYFVNGRVGERGREEEELGSPPVPLVREAFIIQISVCPRSLLKFPVTVIFVGRCGREEDVYMNKKWWTDKCSSMSTQCVI